MKTILSFLFFIVVCLPVSLAQELSLASVFGEGMVLQQKQKVAVWGTAAPKSEVVVEIQEKAYPVKSDKQGKWLVYVEDLKAGGPYTLAVKDAEKQLMLKEVYVGEVWIAGGQSNMQFRLDQADQAERHLTEAQNTDIRYLFVPQVFYAGHTVKDKMVWRTATGKNAGKMSAVAYFFARELQQKLGVPVGIVCVYKGGTPAEAWMSQRTLEEDADFLPILKRYQKIVDGYQPGEYERLYEQYTRELKAFKEAEAAGVKGFTRPAEPMGPRHYKRPCGLYETMLTQLFPFTAKGVIWYQGEANAPRAEQYKRLFPALIAEWRKNFRQPQWPFYFVQLSNYEHPVYGLRPNWAELREAQLETWQTVPYTAMAVSIDMGERHDIHPTRKEAVGKRLAACAFQGVYGWKEMEYSGPVYKKMKVKNQEVILEFDHRGSGLKAEGDRLKGFTIAGSDGVFHEAEARIENQQVIVTAAEVKRPVAVRYGWSNYTEANLFNAEGFPASPFRTDQWDLITKGKK